MANPLRRLLTFGAPAPAWEEVAADSFYKVLWSYYHANDLYANVQRGLDDLGLANNASLCLRNPAFRVVEFYVAKLWSGDGIESENEAIVEPIKQVWRWSNWGAKKRLAARQFACLGDMFLKVAVRNDKSRVYLQLLDPSLVTDFKTDERGFLTECRIDTPQTVVDNNGKSTSTTHTELWDKERYRLWVHTKDTGTPISRLGPVKDDRALSDFGIDFVPIVHARFRDVGNDRGQGCFTHALDKIDEANRMATRMHQLLFRYNSATWALEANGADASGRPLPAPTLGASAGGNVSANTLAMGDDMVFRLPGNARLMALESKIDFGASLSILQDHMMEIEKDLPELAYYQLRQMTDISGRAIQLLLSDAIDRATEARENAEMALIRAQQMALTIGTNVGLFKNIGTYEKGDFEHAFEVKDIIQLSKEEQAAAEKAEVDAKVSKLGLGIPESQLQKELGYSENDLIEWEVEKQAVDEARQAAFDAGQE